MTTRLEEKDNSTLITPTRTTNSNKLGSSNNNAAAAAAAAADHEDGDENDSGDGDGDGASSSSSSPPTILTTAPAPYFCRAFVALGTLICLGSLPSATDLDHATANAATFSHILFPHYGVTLVHVAFIRTLVALFMISASVYTVCCLSWHQTTHYVAGSRLRKATLILSGWRTMAPFTSVCWNLLAASYACSALVTWQLILMGFHPAPSAAATTTATTTTAATARCVQNLLVRTLLLPPRNFQLLLRTASILWSISAPLALLVSSVVKVVLWPRLLAAQEHQTQAISASSSAAAVSAASSPPPPQPPQKSNTTTANLSRIESLIVHNFNSWASLVEVCLVGGLPVPWKHVVLAPLVGFAYIVFSWCMVHQWKVSSAVAHTHHISNTSTTTNNNNSHLKNGKCKSEDEIKDCGAKVVKDGRPEHEHDTYGDGYDYDDTTSDESLSSDESNDSEENEPTTREDTVTTTTPTMPCTFTTTHNNSATSAAAMAGPQFLYFFFDTTVPKLCNTSLVLLSVTLIGFFSLFVVMEHVLEWLGSGLGVHLAFCALLCHAVMRFRD